MLGHVACVPTQSEQTWLPGSSHHAVCKHRPPLKGTATERDRERARERERDTHTHTHTHTILNLAKKERETEVEFEGDMNRDSYI